MSKRWRNAPKIRAQRDEAKSFCTSNAPVTITAEQMVGDQKKLATFEGCAYTGQPMRLSGWFNPVVIDLEGVKTPSQTIPMICQHDDEQLAGHTNAVKIDGSGIHFSGVFSGQAQHVDKVVTPAKNGFPWQVSVGANPVRNRLQFLEAGKTAKVNGVTVTGPMNISRETELINLSFVPTGADNQTSASVAASSAKGTNMDYKLILKGMMAELVEAGKSVKHSDDQIDVMSPEEVRAAIKKAMNGDGGSTPDFGTQLAAFKADLAKAAAEAQREGVKAAAEESRRQSDIYAVAKKHGVVIVEIEADGKKESVNLVAHAIENGWTVDKTELEALRAARPGANVGAPGGLGFSVSTPEVGEAVLEAAVLQSLDSPLWSDDFYKSVRDDKTPGIKASTAKKIKMDLDERYPEKVQQDAWRAFKGRISLHQLLATIGRDNGYRGESSLNDSSIGEIAKLCMRADGSSTISVSNVTANVMNKKMLEGYMYTEQSWSVVAGRAAPKDFKPMKSINLFGDTEFADLGTSSELKNATLDDQAFSNQVTTRGRIITIPRTVLINDDLGAFGRVPEIIGRGAGLKLNRVFWTIFLNPGLDEGGTSNFYAATHTLPRGQVGKSNLLTGAGSVLADAGLDSAQKLFDAQVDPSGNPLGMSGEFLVYGPDNEGTAWRLMHSETLITTALGSTSAEASKGDKNRWFNRFKPVKSVYINNAAFTGNSTTAWWLLGNPKVIPVIEMAFLNGQEMPTVQQAGPDFQFNILGISHRAFFDIGCNSQNFRGGIKSNGA